MTDRARRRDRRVQTHGGIGLGEECDAQRCRRLARMWRIGPITNEQCLDTIAELHRELPRSY